MDHEKQLKKSKYKNWVKGGLALKYLKDGLVGYVDEIVKLEHTRIINKVKLTPGFVCNLCNYRNLKPQHKPSTDTTTGKQCCPWGQSSCNCLDKKKMSCPNKVCDSILEEVLRCHSSTPPAPNWKNIDIHKWCSDPLEIAKCYIKAPGYADKVTINDIDVQGLLHILIHNISLHSHFDCKISGNDIFNKTLNRRNALFHSPSMEIDDRELNEIIDDIIAILEDEKALKKRSDSSEAVSNLKQLKQNDFHITTCIEVDVCKEAIAGQDERTRELEEKVNDIQTMINNLTRDQADILKEQKEQLLERLQKEVDVLNTSRDLIHDCLVNLKQKQESKYRNFMWVYLGFAFIGQILETYTRNGLQRVHQKIYTTLAGEPSCNGTCGNEPSQWCTSCKGWQRELKKFSKCPDKIDWKKQESSKWPLSYEQIASVFMSTPGDGGPVNLRDLSNACSIWTTCNEFKIQPFALENVKGSMNNYFAHTDKLSVTDNEKARAFAALNDLLKQGDVEHHINKEECLNELEKIENGNHLPGSGTEERKVLKRIHDKVTELHRILLFLCTAIFIIVVSLLVYIPLSYRQGAEQKPNDTPPSIYSIYSGCLSESYKCPFPLEVPMLGFLPTQNQLVGREWVFDILEKKMFEQYSKSRGTLMIAGYGFGKSAIVAHLLCARENEKGWKLRQHIVAFHVCKFTHESTKNPVQLIKRLIWFLSVKSAEYGSHIALLNDSIITDDEKCKEEMKLCFDLAITNPLDKLTVPNDSPWIVVIDALDECEDDNGRNRILELLADRLTSMQQEGPKWFKWLITSRKKPSLNKLNKLDTEHLLHENERNYDDIRHFINNQLNITDKDTVNRFVSKSGGNILYIKHALGYIIASGNVSIHNIVDLPSGIEEIYELNFDRLFKTNNDFEVAKSILEVISVNRHLFYTPMIFSRLNTAALFRVIEANKITNKTEFERIMGKLSDYISSDSDVTFIHKSLYEWLFSDTKSNYRLSQSLGHVMLSEYLFNVHGLDATDNPPSIDKFGCIHVSSIFLTLTYHVSESQNSSIQRKYFSLQLQRKYVSLQLSHRKSFPFLLIKPYFEIHTISIKMLTLIVNFVKNKTVENNRFIRFIRNVYQNYVSNRFLLFEVMDAVSFIYENVTNAKDILKYPLHTAAEHCREDVALYLINVVKVSLLERDNHDMRAIDVAANCHCVPVIKLITEKDRSVLDLECLTNVGCIYSRAATEIYKMLEANEVKPTCFDTSLQKEMLMRIYFKSQKRRPYIFSSFNRFLVYDENVCTETGKTSTYFQPELLSCSDSFGYTLALRFITIDARYSFLAVLEKHISDKCQHVSSSMLYMFYLIMYRFTLYNRLYSHRWKRLSPICPEGASVEHLLMQYKRIEMIDLLIAKGHIMNWTKTDRKGMTPLNYTDEMFILQLGCRFGGDIHALSDKDKLVRLCLCDWLYFYLLLVMYAIACCIASFYCVVLYSIETILYKVVFL